MSDKNITELLNALREDTLTGRGVFEGVESRVDKKDASITYYTLVVGKIKSSLTITITKDQFLEFKSELALQGGPQLGDMIQYVCGVGVNPNVIQYTNDKGAGAFITDQLQQPHLRSRKF